MSLLESQNQDDKFRGTKLGEQLSVEEEVQFNSVFYGFLTLVVIIALPPRPVSSFQVQLLGSL